MYSPHIREDLIPRVFQTAKAAGIRMTTWVNRVIERALDSEDRNRNTRKDNDHHPEHRGGQEHERNPLA